MPTRWDSIPGAVACRVSRPYSPSNAPSWMTVAYSGFDTSYSPCSLAVMRDALDKRLLGAVRRTNVQATGELRDGSLACKRATDGGGGNFGELHAPPRVSRRPARYSRPRAPVAHEIYSLSSTE